MSATAHASNYKFPANSIRIVYSIGLDLMREEDFDRKGVGSPVPETVNFRNEELWLCLQQDKQLHPSLIEV
jgi:hypothetical protein